MSEHRSPTTDAPAGPRALSDDDVARLWAVFRAGDIARCPRDAAPLALAVDGSSKAYRLVCTRCGNASQWFETAPTGILVRNAEEPAGPGVSDD